VQCHEALELISGHIDGVNNEKQESCLQAHLASCEVCRQILNAYLDIDAQVAELEEQPPADLVQRVMTAIEEPLVPAKRKRFFFGPGTGFAAVAAVLAFLLGSGAIVLPDMTANITGAKETAVETQSAVKESALYRQNDADYAAVTEAKMEPVAEESAVEHSAAQMEKSAALADASREKGFDMFTEPFSPEEKKEESAGEADKKMPAMGTAEAEKQTDYLQERIVLWVSDADRRSELETEYGLSFQKVTLPDGKAALLADAEAALIRQLQDLGTVSFPETAQGFESWASEDIGYILLLVEK